MKRSVQQAVATRARGHRAVRAVTVAVATLAASTSAGLAWAASATATGRSHHPRATTPTGRPAHRTAPARRHRREDLPLPAGPVAPAASTVPGSLTAPASTAPAPDPYAYAPAPDPYVPPVVSSGGS